MTEPRPYLPGSALSAPELLRGAVADLAVFRVGPDDTAADALRLHKENRLGLALIHRLGTA